MGKAFYLTFADWSEKRELRERREKVSIFPEQEEKFCSTQIEGKGSSKEGMEIKVKTAAFIAGLYSLYGTIFEAAGTIFKKFFLTQISRSVQWLRNRGRKQKKSDWFLLLGMQIETEIYLPGWDKLVWYFLCIVVNDKLLLKNKHTLSLIGFPLVGFSRAIGQKS